MPSRVRTTLARGAVLALVLATAAMGCGANADDTHPLAKAAFQKTKTKKLPGGDRIAYGSPDGHRIVVQWRSPGSTGWSRPVTVYREAAKWTHDINVEAVGDTVAIDPDFWRERVLNDDFAPDHTAQVLCRDRECAEGHRSVAGELSGTQFAEGGDFTAFGLDDRRTLTWDDGEFRTLRFTGLAKQSDVTLLPDGSFAALAPRRTAKGCGVGLSTTERHEGDFTEQAAGPELPSAGRCSLPSPDEVDDDRISFFDETSVSSFSFVRDGDGWRYDGPKSPLVVYADTRGRSTIANSTNQLHDGTAVSVGSPDTRRVYVQTRAEGSREWSAPALLGSAPAGTRCREALVEPGEDADVVLTVGCYRDGNAYDVTRQSTPDVLLGFGSESGRDWTSVEVPRASIGTGLAGLGQYVVQGPTRTAWWQRDRGWTSVDLPSTFLEAVRPSPDGSEVLRFSGDLSGSGRCDPRFQVALVTARSWPTASTPFAKVPTWITEQRNCEVSAYGMDDGFTATVNNQDYEGTVARKGGRWVALPPPTY